MPVKFWKRSSDFGSFLVIWLLLYSETIFLSNNSAVDILENVNNNRISLSGICTGFTFLRLTKKKNKIMIQFSKHIKKLATYDFFCCYNNGTIQIVISMLKVWPWNLFHITVKYYFRHPLDSLDFVCWKSMASFFHCCYKWFCKSLQPYHTQSKNRSLRMFQV